MAELRFALKQRYLVLAALAAALLGACFPAVPARAGTPFDGTWSVLIVTDAGSCDRAYRYALNITNGRISYGDPSFDVSGHVAASGRLRVSVRFGQQQASGAGRLSHDFGQGTWRGRSSTSTCSGHWEAERRG